MKESHASFQFDVFAAARLLTFGLLIGTLLFESGCVSQRAYEQAKAEAAELNRSLDVAREEVKELDQRIGELEADNKEKDATAGELRADIDHEAELLPILRQRANDKLVLLHTQVTNLVNQSRVLARKIADAKQESASLKVLVAQYQEEVEEAQLLSEPAVPDASMPATSMEPSALEVPTPPAEAQIPPPATAATVQNPVPPPQQMAQVTPVTPAKPPTPPRPAAMPPPPVEEESWFDMILNWFASVWNWILGLFS